MYDKEFLTWILQRLINVYGEDRNTDFVFKLASIIERTPAQQHSPNVAMDADIERLLLIRVMP